MRTSVFKEFFCDLDAYVWAPFAGIAAGLAFGWLVGITVTVAFAGLLYGVGRLMKKVIAKSLETTVTQRTPVRRP